MTALAEAPQRAGIPPKVRFKRNWDKRLSFIALHSVGIAMGVIFMLPVLFVFLTAVMASDQAMTASLWPTEWHFENFVKVFQKAPLLEYFGNSLLYSACATAGALLSAIPAAYGLAKLRWRGQNLFFMLTVAAMLLPPQVTVVPLYDLWVRLGLTGLAVMGRNLARNLARHGHTVALHNRTYARTESLVAQHGVERGLNAR